MKKLFLFLFIGMFLFSFASAWDWDNVIVETTDNPNTGYPSIEIKNAFGFGETLFEGSLTEHTNQCGIDCNSKLEFNHTGGVLIDDIRFLTLQDDNVSWVEQDIRSYNLKYETELPEYETECIDLPEVYIPEYDTYYTPQECSQVQIGTYTGFKNYNVGDELSAGYYEMFLEGKKKPSRTVDWQIKIQGQWLEQWAVWGNITLGDDAEVILNNPANSSIQYAKEVTLNASATVTNGATLVNATLYDNSTGSWGARNNSYYTYDLFDDASINWSKWTNSSVTGTSSAVESSGYIRIKAGDNAAGNYILSSINLVDETKSPYFFINVSNLYTRKVCNAGGGSMTSKIEVGNATLLNYVTSVSGCGTSETMEDNAPYLIEGKYENGNWYYRQSYNYTRYWTSDTLYDSNGWTSWTIFDGGELKITQTEANQFHYVNTYTLLDLETTRRTPADGGQLSQTYNNTYSSGSNILWNMQFCDSDGACGFAISNYTFSIDPVPPTIALNYPTSLIDYGAVNGSLQLNFTATDSNLDDVWYDYNGTNVTIAGPVSGVANLSNITLSSKKNVTIYANDTIGNLNATTFSWDYQLFEQQQWYSASTVETSIETFIINVDYNTSLHNLITGKLEYDGTNYTATKSGSGSNVNFSVAITIPNVVADVNNTFSWWFGLVNGSGTKTIQTDSLNQTVRVLNMSLTGFPETVPYINFTVYDEETGNEINASFESTFTYSAVGATSTNEFSYSDTTVNNSRYSFAFDPSDIDYEVDTNIRLSKTGYTTRYYNWQDLVLTNTTTLKSLYLLQENLSTSFIIEVIDAAYNPVVGASVEVERYQEGLGSWINTEVITTNGEGKAIAAHILTEDAQYRFKVYQDGDSIFNSSATTITCEVTPCTVRLVIPLSTPSVDLESLTTTLTYTQATNIFTYTYQDDSGLFSSAYLKVFRFDAGNSSNNNLVCWENGTTSADVLVCDISAQSNATYKAEGYIVRSDSGETLVEVLYGFVGDTIYNRVGIEGVLWSFFLFVGIVMAGLLRPALGIIFGIIGVVALSLLNLISIGVTATFAIIAIGVILLMNLKNGAA